MDISTGASLRYGIGIFVFFMILGFFIGRRKQAKKFKKSKKK